MPTDSTPWLVVEHGPTVPPHTLRLACLRCGDRNDTPLPIDINRLVGIHNQFKARHKGCKENE